MRSRLRNSRGWQGGNGAGYGGSSVSLGRSAKNVASAKDLWQYQPRFSGHVHFMIVFCGCDSVRQSGNSISLYGSQKGESMKRFISIYVLLGVFLFAGVLQKTAGSAEADLKDVV